jgi:hypothetical protein
MQVTTSHLRMARVVEGCTELLPCFTAEGHKSPFPLMRVDGTIYVLPGVPSIMRSKWPCIRDCLVSMYSWRTEEFKNRFVSGSTIQCALPVCCTTLARTAQRIVFIFAVQSTITSTVGPHIVAEAL